MGFRGLDYSRVSEEPLSPTPASSKNKENGQDIPLENRESKMHALPQSPLPGLPARAM